MLPRDYQFMVRLEEHEHKQTHCGCALKNSLCQNIWYFITYIRTITVSSMGVADTKFGVS